MTANNKIQSTFKFLQKMYGKQKWWAGIDQFEIMVGMILVQNTNWNNAEKAIVALKAKNYLSSQKITALSTNELIQLIKPAGLYNQKAKRLKILAAWYSQIQQTGVKEVSTETLRGELLQLHGLGPESVDTILLYAFNRLRFVIDAYTKRLFIRIGIIDKEIPYNTLQSMIEMEIKKDVYLFKEYHALIVHHNKVTCRSKPMCDKCDLKKICDYYENEYLKSS